MGPTNQCKLVASSHASSHTRFASSSTLDARVFPSNAGLKNLAASSRDSGEKAKGLGSRLNTPEGSCNPTMLRPSTISSKRQVSGHPISKAIFFKRQILLGRKMASTPLSRLSLNSVLVHPPLALWPMLSTCLGWLSYVWQFLQAPMSGLQR